jgi:sugar O-acyltransferase (sialic acid O-acetyltransferase NeuD family)
MKKLVLWGSSGQAIVLEEFLSRIGYEIIALFDNNPAAQSISQTIPLYYGIGGFQEWQRQQSPDPVAALVAIGGSRGYERLRLQDQLEQAGLEIITAVHPRAYVAPNATIDRGSQILVHATICARVNIGRASIVNTGAGVDHECSLGNGVHIGPGANLAGCVTIEDFSFVGIGAIILPRIRIGAHTIVGAGAVVTKDLPDHVVAYGNPAKIVRSNRGNI